MKKYAILGYNSLNIGDDIQSFVVSTLLPISYIVLRDDYDKVYDFKTGKQVVLKEKIHLIMNGWFMHSYDGKYKIHNPGFLKEDAHPDGLCVPCCFKNWDKDSQIKRREKCLTEEETKKEKTQKSKSKEKIPAQLDEYIKGPDKFPLEQGRFGYLPFIISLKSSSLPSYAEIRV